MQILSSFISDFFHNFPGGFLQHILKQDNDDKDDGDSELVEEYRKGFESADREDTLDEDDKAAVVKDSNSESDCSLYTAETSFFPKSFSIFSTLAKICFNTWLSNPPETFTTEGFGGGQSGLKKGTLEALTPVKGAEDTGKGDAADTLGNGHVTIEAGNGFMVSTISVKITT